MEKFFEKELPLRQENKIEYAVMENFDKNRIVFAAPHKVTERIYVDEKRFIGVGDKNTDKLAKLGALRLRTCYIAPLFSRIEADLTRDPSMLGKGLTLRSPLYGGEKREIVRIEIHKNKKFANTVSFYHQLLEKLKPQALVFIHGMGRRHKADVSFGFGKECEYIGGKKNAEAFVGMFREKLNEVLESFGFKTKLEIVVAKFFKATKDYGLLHHVAAHNKKNAEKRFGMNVEFNLRGRTTKEDKGLPTKEYQLAAQVLADVVLEWKNRIKERS